MSTEQSKPTERNMVDIRNPMYVIGLFVTVSEVAIVYAFTHSPPEYQFALVALVLGLPVLCLIGFFVVLYFRPQNFYAPQDFRTDSAFLKSITDRATHKAEEIVRNETVPATPELAAPQTAPALAEFQLAQTSEIRFEAKLEPELVRYLIRVANRPLTIQEHVAIVNQEFESVPDLNVAEKVTASASEPGSPENTTAAAMTTVVSSVMDKGLKLGYFAAILRLFQNSLFSVTNTGTKLVYNFSPEMLAKLAESLGSAPHATDATQNAA